MAGRIRGVKLQLAWLFFFPVFRAGLFSGFSFKDGMQPRMRLLRKWKVPNVSISRFTRGVAREITREDAT